MGLSAIGCGLVVAGVGSAELDVWLHPAQVTAEDISTNSGFVELSFRARKLDDKVSVGVLPRQAGPAEGEGSPSQA